MRLFQYAIAMILVLGIFSACNNNSKSAANRRNERFDEVLHNFSDLVATKTIKNPNKAGLPYEYYLHQVYREKGKNGSFTGTLITRNWNDSLKAKGIFKNGYLQDFTQWYSNGQKKLEKERSNVEKTQPVIITKTWYYSGELRSVTNQLGNGKMYYKDGKIKSVISPKKIIDYWENGKKQTLWTFNKGRTDFKMDGIWKAWYQNGILGIDGRYQNGKKDGMWSYFDSTGAKEKVEYFHTGKLDSTMLIKSN